MGLKISEWPELSEALDLGDSYAAVALNGRTYKRPVGYRRTAAEVAAGVTPSNYAYPTSPYIVYRTGATGAGSADDRAALSNAINSGHKWIRIPAGTYLLSTDTAISVPSGVTIEGDGPNTIIRKTSGTADILSTSGSNVTIRNLRMEGPNNTGCDGIITDGGEDILIENIEGYQLSTTVTIGLASASDRVTVSNVYSESNTQQGVLFNKATNVRFSNLRSKNIGSSSLHHGVYVGAVTDLDGEGVFSEGCAGAGLNIFAQSGFAAQRISVRGIISKSCGTSASSVRGGVVVARDSTSSLRGVSLSDLKLYANDEFNLYAQNVDELAIVNPYADGNNEAVDNGVYLGATISGITCNYKVLGGHSKAHGSNIRIPASSGTTINVQVDDITLSDADTGSNAGIFASGAGTVNLDVGSQVRFSNNAQNITFTASAGAVNYSGTTIPKSSFTGTLTGISGADPTGAVEYEVNGGVVTLEIPSISGASDTTAATLTGMPAAIRPAAAQTVLGLCTNNGTQAVSRMDIATNGTITLYNGTSATFTGSGTKAVGPCTVTYRLT